jgi:two-component system, chemotaxis family, sensor kinase Cph1
MRNTNPNPINVTPEKNYDSDFCGSIPLHLVNLIQPHGMLLVLDKEQLQIVQASENVTQYLSVSADELLEQPLAAYLPPQQFTDIQAKINSQNNQEKIPFSLTFLANDQQVALTALVHPKDEYILIELEESTPSSQENSFIGLYQQIKYITSLLKQAGTTAETARLIAAEMKKLTGFDRMLVYQFDPQWNGKVIGQAKEADMDDYMDLRFPASDVPKQARDLYFRNPYRLIPTRSYQPVGLLPVINPLSQRFTDLSECNLRSVATVHLEYLTNMKIMASMSLPIIIDDKLWGLISCHHKTPKNPSYEMRSALELLSGIVSAQIAAKEKEAAMLLRVQLRGIHARLLEQLYNQERFTDGLLTGETGLHDLLNLSGAAVVYDGGLWTSGSTPGDQEIKELTFWLRRNKLDKLYVTDSLPSVYARSQEYHHLASGLIALSINPEQGEYILGFRPEVLQTIEWGGNPNQAIQIEPDGKTYHPRNSFATYQEVVKQTSLPWEPEELDAAEALRSAVLEKIIKENY